ncbi:MAG: nucleotidyltransferase domain-containing protein [Chloroflexi bacterium]|nr:nucleotidyltransferase domain-containing protein [Chloroflexota bacterium]
MTILANQNKVIVTKNRVIPLPDNLSKTLDELKLNLAQALGDNLFLLTLYGSYARDEASADSDVDLLVVLRKSIGEDEALAQKIVYEAMQQMDFAYYLSLYLIDENHYRVLEQQGASLLKNIEQDGQVLWQTA